MEQIKEPAMHSRGTKILGLCFSLCVTLVVSVSCRSDRSDTGWMNQSFDFASEIPATTRDSATYIMQQSLQHNSKFQTFASNIEAKMKVGAFKIGMGGQVRIAEDSVLWAIVHKMGMELVRLKLTPDSLFMCSKVANMAAIYTDRQNHEMMAGFYRICQNLLMRQMDTSLFQNPASLVLNKNKAWEIKGLSDDSVAWTTWIDARSFKILQCIEQRVGAKLIPQIYENTTDPKQYEILEMSRISGFVDRARGTGRPTKKERRSLDAFIEPAMFGLDDFDFDDYDIDN